MTSSQKREDQYSAQQNILTFWEVHPALVAKPLGAVTFDTKANHIGGRILEFRGTLGEGREFRALDHLAHVVERHGRDDVVIADLFTISEDDVLVDSVNFDDRRVQAHILGIDELVKTLPDGTRPTLAREAER